MKTFNQFITESEELSELSVRTLKSYMSKAGGQKYIFDGGAKKLIDQKQTTPDMNKKAMLSRAANILIDKGDRRMDGMIRAGMKIHRKFYNESTHSDGSISPFKVGDEVMHDGAKKIVTYAKHPNYVVMNSKNRQQTAKHHELS